jgi:alcohol dehydrogenase class IV
LTPRRLERFAARTTIGRVRESFTWRDGERLILFGAGGLERAPEILRERGWGSFELATTERAGAEAPALVREARAMHVVPPGPVPELAAELLQSLGAPGPLVALGGGRVIDTAKAVAAVREIEVCAIPTTLSGAELTTSHRLPAGHEDRPRVRPRLVIADPEAMTGLPEPDLRASAMNALAHGIESIFTRLANPAATLLALRGVELVAGSLELERGSRPRGELALGSLLCAWAMDSAGYALHHVLCQSIVRVCATPHAPTNAAMLPHTAAALADNDPAEAVGLAVALAAEPGGIGGRLAALTGGPPTLSELGVRDDQLDEIAAAALSRSELDNLPRPLLPEQVERVLLAAR